MIVDDFTGDDAASALGTRWRGVTDRVMGGVSEIAVTRERIDGRHCLHMTGDVRLENAGGFVQMALDLAPDGAWLDASAFTGLRLVARGNGERYGVHLRTPDAVRPWQSFRAGFVADGAWREVRLPFADFTPHRLEASLDASRLRRLGLVAIGRAFRADLAVAEVSLYARPGPEAPAFTHLFEVFQPPVVAPAQAGAQSLRPRKRVVDAE